MIKIEMLVNGVLSELEPQTDVTAYESVMLTKLLLVSVLRGTAPEMRDEFINKHKLQRHFIKSEDSQ